MIILISSRSKSNVSMKNYLGSTQSSQKINLLSPSNLMKQRQSNEKENKSHILLPVDGKLFSFYLEEIKDLKSQFVCQSNIIKEYEGWINLMLNIINCKRELVKHQDFASHIEKVNQS